MNAWLDDFIAREQLPPDFAGRALAICEPLAARIVAEGKGPGFLVGICGTQASGKSTLTAVLRHLLEGRGLRVASLSLDDLYLTHAQRAQLAARVHPLLATRGVPGTHDMVLGGQVLAALKGQGEVALPSFDKASDDRRPVIDWPRVPAPVDVILLEGWCVGTRPQPLADLVAPVNALEREEDPDGVWRAFANDALAGPYREFFDRLDLFVLLQAPSFEVVLAWRREQEAKLRARLASAGADPARSMGDEAVARFIAHYERITRWILQEAPARADIVVRLDAQRRSIG